MDGGMILDGDLLRCRKVWVHAQVDGEAPAPLVSHTATLWHERYLVVIGGGRHCVQHAQGADAAGQWRMSSEVHLLDLEEMRWSKLEARGDVFPPRRGHCAVLLPASGNILVFGGTDGESPDGIESTRADVCELDLDACNSHVAGAHAVWRARQGCEGEVPPPRRGHCGWASLDGTQLLVVGGFCTSQRWSSVYDTSLYSFAPTARTWCRLETCGEAPLLVLAAAALLADRSVVAIVGGAAVTPFSDGLSLLDQRTLTWSHPHALPHQRVARRYSAAATLVGSTLILFGGTELNRSSAASSDVFALDLSAHFEELHQLAARAAANAATEPAPASPSPSPSLSFPLAVSASAETGGADTGAGCPHPQCPHPQCPHPQCPEWHLPLPLPPPLPLPRPPH
ncbi:hypothetical protein T492DRAFT_173962 [Pavlovales sp. CCMP2436]|nr:hypothetical protein T492DRAFT_173962 [Pavlovales sp. CCMP2436]